jgi:hypothetical protein
MNYWADDIIGGVIVHQRWNKLHFTPYNYAIKYTEMINTKNGMG